MSTYYYSACHDCKEKVMWDKTSQEQAFRWHSHVFKKIHPEHNHQFDSEYNDDFYDKILKYRSKEVISHGERLGS